jgi:hypothetical protein
VVFKLTPSNGGYAYSVLHYFTGGVDGGCPDSRLTADRSGVLYSTTSCGGLSQAGTVFKLVPTLTGYQVVTLHEFNPQSEAGQSETYNEGVLLEGDYLLGETLGTGVPGRPNFNGAIYALKIPL